MIGKRWLVETVGAGVAVLDYDGDGRWDIWLVQGGPLFDPDAERPSDRLYRNVGTPGTFRFEDVTDASGIDATGYGMGIATGDVDGDGDTDVFLANYGANQFFENLGDGRFRDVTSASGLGVDAEWSASASFADIDGDGRLDLYVGNYLEFDESNHRDCTDIAGRPSYCAPDNYRPVGDRLFRNVSTDDLIRFEDVTTTAGIAAAAGPALGVVADDYDGDGDVDFYVANDGTANLLWINDGTGRFTDEAEIAFIAFNQNGAAEAGMGVDAADYDHDCDVDVFVTHLATETNTLYVNEGGWFMDVTNQAGLGASSGPYTGFGTGWFDADNDGDLDLFSANGAVSPVAMQRDAGVDYPLKQKNQVWENDGRGRYREIDAGPALAHVEVSRGAAFGDLDDDGDVDIVVTNNRGPARIFENRSEGGHWIGIELAPDPGQATVGATIELVDSHCTSERVATDGSYASAHDPRVRFGLGASDAPKRIRVRWPSGRTTVYGPLPVDRYHRLEPIE